MGLVRLEKSTPCDDSSEILVGRTERKDGLDEQVDGNGGISSLHLSDTGLARFECFCEIDLRHAAGLTARLESLSELEAEFDEEFFFAGQSEKFFGTPELRRWK
jgi:hypothetical protein